jgi:hypothetical protein
MYVYQSHRHQDVMYKDVCRVRCQGRPLILQGPAIRRAPFHIYRGVEVVITARRGSHGRDKHDSR